MILAMIPKLNGEDIQSGTGGHVLDLDRKGITLTK
jgi:hypothetical protein